MVSQVKLFAKQRGLIRTPRSPATYFRYGKARSNAVVDAPVMIPRFATREEGVACVVPVGAW